MLDRGRLAGYILGRRGEDWLAAGSWVVSAENPQPQGLLEDLACEAGERVLYLGVLAANTKAVELVKSLGFIENDDSPWRMAYGPGEAWAPRRSAMHWAQRQKGDLALAWRRAFNQGLGCPSPPARSGCGRRFDRAPAEPGELLSWLL